MFQYSIALLSLSFYDLDDSLRQQQKQSYSSQPNYIKFPIIQIKYSTEKHKMDLLLNDSISHGNTTTYGNTTT